MPERGTVFLSHAAEDKGLTAKLKTLIRELSLNQIDIWFSSDDDYAGGIHPGEQWFEKIRQKMQLSSSIMALLTPNSMTNRWVLFESGIGAGLAEKKLIVATHGIESMSEIPAPLSFWQAFRLDKQDGLREFCSKLLSLYDVHFSDVLFKNYSRNFLKVTAGAKQVAETFKTQSSSSLETERLIEHFDRRFFEIASHLNLHSDYVTYTIFVTNDFDHKTYKIEIEQTQSIQDVLDSIYDNILEGLVEAYQYLQKWLLIHDDSQLKLIVREVAPEIPAHIIFKPGAKWTATKLTKPYSPAESEAEKWLGRRINKAAS